MHRPSPRTVAMIATTATVASFVLALIAGTGPVVGVFLLTTIIGLAVSTLAWKAARTGDGRDQPHPSRWRTLLGVGIALLAAVLVVINVPPYNDRDLPEAGWALMMLSLVTSVALITIGLTTGFAQRSTRRTLNR